MNHASSSSWRLWPSFHCGSLSETRTTHAAAAALGPHPRCLLRRDDGADHEDPRRRLREQAPVGGGQAYVLWVEGRGFLTVWTILEGPKEDLRLSSPGHEKGANV